MPCLGLASCFCPSVPHIKCNTDTRAAPDNWPSPAGRLDGATHHRIERQSWPPHRYRLLAGQDPPKSAHTYSSYVPTRVKPMQRTVLPSGQDPKTVDSEDVSFGPRPASPVPESHPYRGERHIAPPRGPDGDAMATLTYVPAQGPETSVKTYGMMVSVLCGRKARHIHQSGGTSSGTKDEAANQGAGRIQGCSHHRLSLRHRGAIGAKWCMVSHQKCPALSPAVGRPSSDRAAVSHIYRGHGLMQSSVPTKVCFVHMALVTGGTTGTTQGCTMHAHSSHSRGTQVTWLQALRRRREKTGLAA